MQTPNDTRTIEAKRLDDLALQYRNSRDPAIVAATRALARRLSDIINNPIPAGGMPTTSCWFCRIRVCSPSVVSQATYSSMTLIFRKPSNPR